MKNKITNFYKEHTLPIISVCFILLSIALVWIFIDTSEMKKEQYIQAQANKYTNLNIEVARLSSEVDKLDRELNEKRNLLNNRQEAQQKLWACIQENISSITKNKNIILCN